MRACGGGLMAQVTPPTSWDCSGLLRQCGSPSRAARGCGDAQWTGAALAQGCAWWHQVGQQHGCGSSALFTAASNTSPSDPLPPHAWGTFGNSYTLFAPNSDGVVQKRTLELTDKCSLADLGQDFCVQQLHSLSIQRFGLQMHMVVSDIGVGLLW